MSRAMLAAAILALSSAVATAQTGEKVPPPANQMPEATSPQMQRPPGTIGESSVRPIHPAERDRIVVPPPADTERNINPK